MEGDVAFLSQLAVEVESNMQLLKYEAEKAGEYLQVKEEKDYLESCLMTIKAKKLYKEAAALNCQHNILELSLAKEALHKKHFEQLLEEPERRLKERRTLREETAREEVRLQLEKEHLSDRMKITQERKTWLEIREKECAEFMEKSGDELKALIQKQKNEKDNLEKLALGIEDCKTALKNLKIESHTVISQIALSQEKSKRINGRYVDTLSAKAQMGNKLSSVEKEISMIEKETNDSEERLIRLRENSIKLNNKIKSDEKIYGMLTKKLAALKQSSVDIEEKSSQLEEKLNQVRHELQVTRDKHVQVSSRQKLLTEMHKKYEGYAFPVQELFKYGSELPGICGVVGDLLEVPEKYRIAVETALGSKINNIVTETTENAKEAIQFLRKRNAGRLTFLPLDVLQSSRRVNEAGDVPGFTLVSDVVGVEDRYRVVAEYLLGRILLVENLDAGLDLARKTGFRYTIVTERGEMIHPGGALTGGSLKKNSGSVVGRGKTIEQLGVEAKRLIKKMSAINEEKTAIENSIRVERQNAAGTADEISRVSIRIQETETSKKYIKNQLQSLEREEEVLLKERHRLGAVKEELLKSKNELFERSLRLERRLEKIKYVLDSRDELIAALRKEEEYFNSEVLNTEVKLSSLEQRYNYAQKNMEEFYFLQGEMISRHKEKKSEHERFAADLLAVEKEILGIKRRLQINHEARAERLLAGEELDREITVLEETKQNYKRIVTKITIKLQDLEKELSHNKMKKLQVQMEVDRLEQYMETDNSIRFVELYTLDASHIESMEKKLPSLRKRLEELGPVNISSIEEYSRVETERAGFAGAIKDIKMAQEDLKQISNVLERVLSRQFSQFFKRLQKTFNETYQRVFGGGCAQLLLKGDSALEGEIEISVQPPGKRPQSLSLLSGGERALTALTLLFSILEENRSPFCILDEVDTSLDDHNLELFNQLLEYYSKSTQFIVVSHRQRTMETADNLFGVTMPEDGVSAVVSVALEREVG